MIKNYQPDKIVVTNLENACSNEEYREMLCTMDFNEFCDFVTKPVLAYRTVSEDEDGDEYELCTQISGTFDSYAEAEAARLQFIHDHCELPKDNFDL